MTSVRIYGFVDGYGSYAQVTRGVALGLSGNGVTELDVLGVDQQSDFDEDPKGLPLADVAILTSPPALAPAMLQGSQHARRMAFVHPNSDKLPERTMAAVNACATHILAASRWSAPVIAKYTTLPILVVPHGIHPDMQVLPDLYGLDEPYQRGEFRVLHMSSSGRQRKGTIELCKAWGNLMARRALPDRSVLSLVLVPDARQRVLEWMMGEDARKVNGIRLRDRFGVDGAPPTALARQIYSSQHVLCQPSRGEAFGLTPTEALACGVPVVATRATGHSEWFKVGLPGAVEVQVGPDAPIDDMAGATAPSLPVENLEEALLESYTGWHALKAAAVKHAATLASERSWPKQMEAFVASCVQE